RTGAVSGSAPFDANGKAATTPIAGSHTSQSTTRTAGNEQAIATSSSVPSDTQKKIGRLAVNSRTTTAHKSMTAAVATSCKFGSGEVSAPVARRMKRNRLSAETKKIDATTTADTGQPLPPARSINECKLPSVARMVMS